MVSEQCQSGT